MYILKPPKLPIDSAPVDFVLLCYSLYSLLYILYLRILYY